MRGAPCDFTRHHNFSQKCCGAQPDVQRVASRVLWVAMRLAFDVLTIGSNILIRPPSRFRAVGLGGAFLGATMTSSQADTHDPAPTFQRDEGTIPIVVPSPAVVCSINADSHSLAITSSNLTQPPCITRTGCSAQRHSGRATRILVRRRRTRQLRYQE